MSLIEYLKSLPHMQHGEEDFVNAPNYYPWLSALANSLKAYNILEVGVLNGYAAVSFIRGNPIWNYTGIDNGSFIKGSMEYAEANLKKLQSEQDFHFDLITKDTQKLTTTDFLESGEFNFIHIDGDHSYNGALHDMNLLWPSLSPYGHMIVDDSIHHSDVVGKACLDFAKQTGAPNCNVNTFRGSWVFMKTK